MKYVERDFKKEIIKHIDSIADKLIDISQKIFNHPELGYQEFTAMKFLTDFLAENGFEVEKGIAGLPTAFVAKYIYPEVKLVEDKRPTVAFLAEYDALPELGHACGHNIIGTASVGAAIGLTLAIKNSELEGLGGKIVVLGTPAEETSGGKVELIQQGYFNDIDAAMMIHPGDCNVVKVSSLALDAMEFIFHGQASHAAAVTNKGINALSAVISFFNGINALRSRFNEDVKIHGIISEGGIAPNIIPERAAARFYLRAKDRVTLNEVVKEVVSTAQEAATMTGAEVSWHNYEVSYENMITNEGLAQIFESNLRYLGIEEIVEERKAMGSIDMGNVSHVVAAIHPYISIGPEGLEAHTREFCTAVSSQAGKNALILGAKALALTGYDFMKGKN